MGNNRSRGGKSMTTVMEDKLTQWIDQATEGLDVNKDAFLEKIHKTGAAATNNHIIKRALENIDETSPDWTFVASRLYLKTLYEQAAANRGYDAGERYGSFYELIQTLTEKGIYTNQLLNTYTKNEIDYFAGLIEPERDLLFNYLGLYTLATRYLATDHDKNIYELPQERWMIIAMHLMQQEEQAYRSQHVAEAYWALSHLYMTVATATITNAGKTHVQLSSWLIDKVDYRMQSIYDRNTEIAKLSKNGGGIGVYKRKVRDRGSSFKGLKGMYSGVVLWIMQLNYTAFSV